MAGAWAFAVLFGLFWITVFTCAFIADRRDDRAARPQVRWSAPVELNNDDRAWLNSQLELAGASHLEIPVKINKSVHGYPPPGARKSPAYKARTDKEIARAAGYLRNLETQSPGLIDWHNKTVTYNHINDTYRCGGREISGVIYRDMVEDGAGCPCPSC